VPATSVSVSPGGGSVISSQIGFGHHRAVEPARRGTIRAQIGRGQIDAIGVGEAEIGADEDRHAQPRIVEHRAHQPRFAEIGLRQIAAREYAVAEIVMLQFRSGAVRASREELLVGDDNPVDLALLKPDRLGVRTARRDA